MLPAHLSSVFLTLALLAPPTPAAQSHEPSSLPTTAAHMAWFREARFGMFIHWGLYSQLAGEWEDQVVSGGAEWIQKYLGIPSSRYSELASRWNPVAYDAGDWVRRMKAAGVRYICITSKHHDGFCLWPTEQNADWNVAVTPGGRDLLAPLADACREQGVVFCLYHSVLDWHHPDWPARPGFNDYARGAPDKERYKREYLFPQLEELFGRYGEIGMLWLDGTWDAEWTSEDGRELEAFVRGLQPSVVLNNRSGFRPPQPEYGFEVQNSYGYIFAGDYISPEGEVPPTGLPGIDWETCQTMQLPNNWGYNRTVGFRPFADLLRQLVDVSSKGGNLLLNVGPDASGALLPQASACLDKFAAWMAVNSESIHGTTASPFDALPFEGRCTRKPGRLYLHVLEWPAELLVPVRSELKRAYLLADTERSALAMQRSNRGWVVTLPPEAPDRIDSVVVVELEGELEVLPSPKNLALGKPVTVSSSWPGRPELAHGHITDADPGTMWATEENARSGWVEVDLQAEHFIHAARLSDAPYRRIRAYELEAFVDGGWQLLVKGDALDAAQRLSFPEVRAQRFRLRILEATDTPTLADFQLFGE